MDRFSKYCKVISGYAFKAKDLMEEGDIPVVKIGNILFDRIYQTSGKII